ncbi:MAG: hypothetical protein H6574_09820 [Lewinellaceae bacterium]|nr:hypothetical protein [Lewinellaceae bacterium]
MKLSIYTCIFLFYIPACLTSCKPNYIYIDNGNTICKDLQNEFIKSKFTCSKDLDAPVGLIRHLSKTLKEDYTIAKYGKEYNKTDIPVYPNKRIIYNGIRSDLKFGFVLYEKGGLAITRHLILYKKTWVTQFWLKGAYLTIEDLKENFKR